MCFSFSDQNLLWNEAERKNKSYIFDRHSCDLCFHFQIRDCYETKLREKTNRTSSTVIPATIVSTFRSEIATKQSWEKKINCTSSTVIPATFVSTFRSEIATKQSWEKKQIVPLRQSFLRPSFPLFLSADLKLPLPISVSLSFYLPRKNS